MAEYYKVPNSELEKISACFSGVDELNEFALQFCYLNEFYEATCKQMKYQNKQDKKNSVLKLIFVIGMFYKNNVEVLRDISANVNYSVLEGLDG